MTTVTRTLHATSSHRPTRRATCQTIAFVGTDPWRRYGALGSDSKRAEDIRKEVTAGGWYALLTVYCTILAETTEDAVNDILTYQEAACKKVRQASARRTFDQAERKRLYTLLKRDKWLLFSLDAA